jgi:glycosyltransferase involved in cell wall biosynthesis
MKILIYSHLFSPSVGGSETAAMLLAEGFADAGHEVRVVTQTPAAAEMPKLPFAVLRQPSARDLWRAVRWCDACVHSNMSLRAAWPLMLTRRPWFIVHHSRLTRVDGSVGMVDRVKLLALRGAYNLSVSHSMARDLPVPSVVLGNAYDDGTFRCQHHLRREQELIFVGRLNRDKGAHVAVAAVAELARRGRRVQLTVVGTGTEDQALRRQVEELNLKDRVIFFGRKSGNDLARLLNQHRIIVVPSLVPETFGIVTLEGLGCGCVVVASDIGGLPESTGPCGLTFPAGNAGALADRVQQLLEDASLVEKLAAEAPGHLVRFTRRQIVRNYLKVIENVVLEGKPFIEPQLVPTIARRRA